MSRNPNIRYYELAYEEFVTYKKMWAPRVAYLGKARSVREACEKAMCFVNREDIIVDYGTMYVVDTANGEFHAVER